MYNVSCWVLKTSHTPECKYHEVIYGIQTLFAALDLHQPVIGPSSQLDATLTIHSAMNTLFKKIYLHYLWTESSHRPGLKTAKIYTLDT